MAYGQGSIRLRKGAGKGQVYEVRAFVGTDPVTHQPRQVSRTVRGGITEARRVLRELQGEIAEGRHGGTRATFGALLDEWASDVERRGKPGTVRGVQLVVAGVFKPALGHLALDKVSAHTLEAFYTAQADAKKKPGTIRRYHAQLSAALSLGVRWGWIKANPANNARPPSPEAAEIRPPSVEDVRRLIEAAEKEHASLGTALALLALTGMRRAELCGLQWGDVDLDGGTIEVRRSVSRGIEPGTLVLTTPKTARSVRRLVIGEAGVAILKAHRGRCESFAYEMDATLTDGSFVVSYYPNGAEPLAPETLTTLMSKLRRRLKLPDFRLHDLRHFVASAMIAQGLNVRQVSDALGHSRPSITLDVYSHQFGGDLDERRKASSALEGLVLPAPTESAELSV